MSKASSKTNDSPLVTVRIRPTGPNCPIGFSTDHDHQNDNSSTGSNEISFCIVPGGCIWLDGPSGRGKTTIAMSMVPELHHQQMKVLQKLHLHVQCEWSSHVVPHEPSPPSVGILFQQTTLIDELTVAGNLALAIQCNNKNHHHHHHHHNTSSSLTTTKMTSSGVQSQMKSVMEMVGLNYQNDIDKRYYELSGGWHDEYHWQYNYYNTDTSLY